MARGVPTRRAHGLTLASCLMCVHTKKSAVITAEGGLTFYLSSKVGDVSQKLAGHSLMTATCIRWRSWVHDNALPQHRSCASLAALCIASSARTPNPPNVSAAKGMKSTPTASQTALVVFAEAQRSVFQNDELSFSLHLYLSIVFLLFLAFLTRPQHQLHRLELDEKIVCHESFDYRPSHPIQ